VLDKPGPKFNLVSIHRGALGAQFGPDYDFSNVFVTLAPAHLGGRIRPLQVYLLPVGLLRPPMLGAIMSGV
jgi:hypothetical protein